MHSHLFFCCCVPQPLSHISLRLSPAQFVFLFSPSHIFSIPLFFIPPHQLCFYSPLWFVNHFIQNNILFCLFHLIYLHLRAPKSLRTGLLSCTWSPSPFFEQRVLCICFLTEIRTALARLLSRQAAPSSCDAISSYHAAFWNHLCFTNGWIELVILFYTPYEPCFLFILFFF